MGEKQSAKATKICDSSIYLQFFQCWVCAGLLSERRNRSGFQQEKSTQSAQSLLIISGSKQVNTKGTAAFPEWDPTLSPLNLDLPCDP